MLDVSGINWINVNVAYTGTTTLLSDLNITGKFSGGKSSASYSVIINGDFNINVGGDLTVTGDGSYIDGSATIIMNGTGTWSGSNIDSAIKNNLVFNTTGTITLG